MASMLPPWLLDNMREVPRDVAIRQTGLGVLTGLLTGALMKEAGKAFALTVGTTVILILLAEHRQYLLVNWPIVRTDAQRAQDAVLRVAENRLPTNTLHESAGLTNTEACYLGLSCRSHWASPVRPAGQNEICQFMQENIFFVAGFSSGFLMGILL